MATGQVGLECPRPRPPTSPHGPGPTRVVRPNQHPALTPSRPRNRQVRGMQEAHHTRAPPSCPRAALSPVARSSHLRASLMLPARNTLAAPPHRPCAVCALLAHPPHVAVVLHAIHAPPHGDRLERKRGTCPRTACDRSRKDDGERRGLARF